MRHRPVFLSVCLIGTAFGADGAAQSLGRPASPAAMRHDMSYGSWTDLPDGWGYFPPSSIGERQKLLAWAERIRADAVVLERRLVARVRAGQPSAELDAVRVVRFEAETLRQDLLFGSHMADFRPSLEALASALDAAVLRESSDLTLKRWLETRDEEFAKIVKASGPWPRTPLVSRRLAFVAGSSDGSGKSDSQAEARSSTRP